MKMLKTRQGQRRHKTTHMYMYIYCIVSFVTAIMWCTCKRCKAVVYVYHLAIGFILYMNSILFLNACKGKVLITSLNDTDKSESILLQLQKET